MKPRGLQLSRRHRLTLYTASLLLLISGGAWAWANFLDRRGEAGEALRDFKPWLLKIHGFSAMAFVLLLGTLLSGHVRRGWHARKNRGNGGFFLSAVSLLTWSGYALYYLGDENWREFASQLHLWLGLAAPILLIDHIRRGRRAARRQPSRKPHRVASEHAETRD
jgi:uncharacterized membrane protein YbhN (UPF0104 family)